VPHHLTSAFDNTVGSIILLNNLVCVIEAYADYQWIPYNVNSSGRTWDHSSI